MVVAFTPGYSWRIALSFTAICLSLYLFISQAGDCTVALKILSTVVSIYLSWNEYLRSPIFKSACLVIFIFLIIIVFINTLASRTFIICFIIYLMNLVVTRNYFLYPEDVLLRVLCTLCWKSLKSLLCLERCFLINHQIYYFLSSYNSGRENQLRSSFYSPLNSMWHSALGNITV